MAHEKNQRMKEGRERKKQRMRRRREKSTVPFTLISGLWALERKKKRKKERKTDKERKKRI